MHKVASLGIWSYPHPNPPPNNPGLRIDIELFERPPETARPQSVTEYWIDEESNHRSREIPFHDPILGASHRCHGCGEPFGHQLKIRPQEWVSVPCLAYDTDRGRMYFCQDAYSCSKRAADRLPQAVPQKVQMAVEQFHEDTDGGMQLGWKICALKTCKMAFSPSNPVQKYHTKACQLKGEQDRIKARKKAAKAQPATAAV